MTVDPVPLSRDDHALLLNATGRGHFGDALQWIAEERPVTGGLSGEVLTVLVRAADAGWPGAEAALRIAARAALHSTLDTSADLVATDMITPPHEYQNALAAVAERTASGELTDITVQAVGAAQHHNDRVIETLALVAGLSWRDLRDRCEARGVNLPGKPQGPWAVSQIRAAFQVVDEIVTGRVQPRLAGAVGARPLELLLPKASSWRDVETLRTGGVSYGTLLAQRDVGSAWSAHRNRTNTQISRLMILQVLAALNEAGVRYWSTEGPTSVPQSFLAKKAGVSGKAPGQLSVVTQRPDGSPASAVFVAIARDGGTARKTAATFLKLPDVLPLPALMVLLGGGWAERGESDRLIRAFGGRIYTEHTLLALAAAAAELSGPAGTMAHPTVSQERA